MVISVNQQPDGTADSIINDVSKQLERLRTMANALGLPHSNAINWTLISSSSSDSASSQKRFNKLAEQQKDTDRQKFSDHFSETAFDDGLEIIENFCAMHLGCNLRKAFLVGMKSQCHEQVGHGNREYNPVDTLVHEFYKLFGKYGTPEYGFGFLLFPDFLELMSTDRSLAIEDSVYYKSCGSLVLDRQIGNRYFVTAANATKVLFLRKAAISFLEFTGRNINGNKLDKDLYVKLKDPNELVQLKADGLMFFHVYADLAMLAKSKDLGKSVLDMNIHYLELQMFLKEIQHNPQAIMDDKLRVFASEKLLYSSEKKLNHRVRDRSKLVKEYIFCQNEWDSTLLFPIMVAGTATMECNLTTYARTQLPGGIYWEPEEQVREILKDVEPSNDICESILGLNDYLNSAIPNIHQGTRSNLNEIKKNKTMTWLDALTNERQEKILGMAVEQRVLVSRERKEVNEKQAAQRREKLHREHIKRQALEQRAQKEKKKLSQIHLIVSVEELHQKIKQIDEEDCNVAKKKAKKLTLLREQLNIRKKILKQDVRITFTCSRKQRPIDDIVAELSEYIACNSSAAAVLNTPVLLIGKSIKHKFIVESQEEKWFSGVIIDYDFETKAFDIVYEDDDEHYFFDIAQDIMLEDFVIIQD